MNEKFKRFNDFLISNNFTLLSEFKNLSTRVDIKCNNCGNEFYQEAHAHISQK